MICEEHCSFKYIYSIISVCVSAKRPISAFCAQSYTIALSKADTVSRTTSLYGFSGESQSAILLCGITTGIRAWMALMLSSASIVRIEKDGSRSFNERIYSPAIYNGSSFGLIAYLIFRPFIMVFLHFLSLSRSESIYPPFECFRKIGKTHRS